METKECICKLLDSPTYHVRDDPHSIETKWGCPIHGHQERYWLIHKEKVPYCIPCQKTTNIEDVKRGIGFLRQWLNEDRITEPKKMVTNEEIHYWLFETKL